MENNTIYGFYAVSVFGHQDSRIQHVAPEPRTPRLPRKTPARYRRIDATRRRAVCPTRASIGTQRAKSLPRETPARYRRIVALGRCRACPGREVIGARLGAVTRRRRSCAGVSPPGPRAGRRQVARRAAPPSACSRPSGDSDTRPDVAVRSRGPPNRGGAAHLNEIIGEEQLSDRLDGEHDPDSNVDVYEHLPGLPLLIAVVRNEHSEQPRLVDRSCPDLTIGRELTDPVAPLDEARCSAEAWKDLQSIKCAVAWMPFPSGTRSW